MKLEAKKDLESAPDQSLDDSRALPCEELFAYLDAATGRIEAINQVQGLCRIGRI